MHAKIGISKRNHIRILFRNLTTMEELTALQDKDMGLGLGKNASGCYSYLYLWYGCKIMFKPRPRLTFL